LERQYLHILFIKRIKAHSINELEAFGFGEEEE